MGKDYSNMMVETMIFCGFGCFTFLNDFHSLSEFAYSLVSARIHSADTRCKMRESALKLVEKVAPFFWFVRRAPCGHS